MNAKLIFWIAAPIVGLIVVGWLAIWLVGALFSAIGWVFGALFYLVVGVAAVAAIVWGIGKARGQINDVKRKHGQITD